MKDIIFSFSYEGKLYRTKYSVDLFDFDLLLGIFCQKLSYKGKEFPISDEKMKYMKKLIKDKIEYLIKNDLIFE